MTLLSTVMVLCALLNATEFIEGVISRKKVVPLYSFCVSFLIIKHALLMMLMMMVNNNDPCRLKRRQLTWCLENIRIYYYEQGPHENKKVVPFFNGCLKECTCVSQKVCINPIQCGWTHKVIIDWAFLLLYYTYKRLAFVCRWLLRKRVGGRWATYFAA